MTAKRSKRSRGPIIWRRRVKGGAKRAYADFRRFGGPRYEALVAPGESTATTDEDVASVLYAERVRAYEKDRTAKLRGEVLEGRGEAVTLEAFAAHHLVEKAKRGKVTDAQLADDERRLLRAVAFFGAGRALASIRPSDVRAWLGHLRTLPVRRAHQSAARPMGEANVRHHLNSLSNLYRRAVAEERVAMNPAAALMPEDRPSAAPARATGWLEAHELALLLEVARRYRPKRADIGAGFALPLLATLALTGGRPDEVLSLEVRDIDFARELVHFRPNGWQRQGDRLKTARSERTVRLWPQLAEILREYLNSRTAREVLEDGPRSPLLFPSPATGKKLRDVRRLVDAVATRAGWGVGSVRPRMFRHSYASARLQTLDAGAPVSLWTVAKELGHGSEEMLKKHYGRLGTVRHRAEVVEFRIEQHGAAVLPSGLTVEKAIAALT